MALSTSAPSLIYAIAKNLGGDFDIVLNSRPSTEVFRLEDNNFSYLELNSE